MHLGNYGGKGNQKLFISTVFTIALRIPFFGYVKRRRITSTSEHTVGF